MCTNAKGNGSGAQALSQVELAILEVTGEITVVLNDSKPLQRDLIDYLRTPPTGNGPSLSASGDDGPRTRR